MGVRPVSAATVGRQGRRWRVWLVIAAVLGLAVAVAGSAPLARAAAGLPDDQTATADSTPPPLSAPVTPAPQLHPVAGAPGPESWVPSTPALWPQVVSAASSAPQTITRGVTWTEDQYQTVSGAQQAQVLNLNLGDPNVHLGMVEAGDSIIDPSDEVISSMAGRTGAVAGVNADFFAIHASGAPEGMVVHGGELQSSPVGSWPYDLEVLSNGQVEMATESFSGTVNDATQGSSQPLGDVNRLGLSADADLSLVTPAMGGTPIGASVVATATLQAGSATNEPTVVVDSVSSGVTSLPALTGSAMDLVASAGTTAANWLTGTVKPGDTLDVTEALSPYPLQGQATGSTPYVATAVSGGATLLHNGQLGVPLQGGGENNVNYPVVGIGVTKDGSHAIMAVFDGEQAENQAVGLTRPQQAEWFAAHGAYNAIEFDSGGSAEMVGRVPGADQVSVLNKPSDGGERDVANGLFVYSTEPGPGPAVTTRVNDGGPLTMLAGTTLSVPVSATDADGNPAAGIPQLSVEPASAATILGTSTSANGTHLVQLQAGAHAQSARLVVRAGRAVSSEPLRVVSTLGSLALSPADPDVANGGTVDFSLTAKAGSASVVVPMSSVTWNVTPSSLGSVSSDGVFTADASNGGLATVTATAGGASATASVAVGQRVEPVDPMTDVSAFSIIDKFMDVYPRNVPAPGATSIADGSISASTVSRLTTDSGSIDIHYDFKPAQTVYHVNLYPNDLNHDVIGPDASGKAPTAYAFWIKTVPALTGGIYLTSGYYDAVNAPLDYNVSPPATDGWQQIVVPLPATTRFPIQLNYINLVSIDPTHELSGEMYVSDLEALYSPRAATTAPYVPIPENPPWLQYKESPADFSPGGQTVMSFDDAHLTARDPGSTSAVDLGVIAKQLPRLPAQAQPHAIQAQGDMVDSGTLDNLNFLKQQLSQFNLPTHLAVGNHEVSQGSDPENGNYTSVFGATHYTWSTGNAEFIVADDAHGGLTASDPYQVPAGDQYPWLVQQLSQTTAKDVIIVAHEPAYDPHTVQNSQMGDRYEAQMYELLAQKFQTSHPGVHVTLLFGHARGFSEQLLDPAGNQVRNGIPNIVVADLGVPAYAPADQGGLYHYVLFHYTPNGTVQFAVQPILERIAIDSPARTGLTVGATATLTATGTSYAGDDYPAITVPIADPVSHVWSSSNPQILSVDPVTGQVTAHHRGAATITVEAGSVTASVPLTVTS